MDRSVVFKKEISYIENKLYQEDLKFILSKLPDYFFEVPASSTGKYHPKYAGTKHGLVKHSKVVMRNGRELINNPINESGYSRIAKNLGFSLSDLKDLVLIACLIHDGMKSGTQEEYLDNKYTKFDHPVLMGEFIRHHKDDFKGLKELEIEFLYAIISTHMGPWNKDYKTNYELPLPSETNPSLATFQRFVHTADYLASKKYLNVEFNCYLDIIDGSLLYHEGMTIEEFARSIYAVGDTINENELEELIEEISNQQNIPKNGEHVLTLQEVYTLGEIYNIALEVDELCPQCGHRMRIRTGQYGPFISCSNYPNCRYIKK